jgi:hypothetical protein
MSYYCTLSSEIQFNLGIEMMVATGQNFRSEERMPLFNIPMETTISNGGMNFLMFFCNSSTVYVYNHFEITPYSVRWA